MTKEEFKKQVLPSKDKLFRVACAMLGNKHEAEDTLQDVFLKLWNMRTRLQNYNSIEALAMTMTKNQCLDKIRSYKHRMQDQTDFEDRITVSAENDPYLNTVISEGMKTIQNIFSSLPNKQKLVFQLRDIEQYRYEEISDITGLTVNSIRVNLSRARKKIREEYLKRQNYGHQEN